jgi:hypothetical protein
MFDVCTCAGQQQPSRRRHYETRANWKPSLRDTVPWCSGQLKILLPKRLGDLEEPLFAVLIFIGAKTNKIIGWYECHIDDDVQLFCTNVT